MCLYAIFVTASDAYVTERKAYSFGALSDATIEKFYSWFAKECLMFHYKTECSSLIYPENALLAMSNIKDCALYVFKTDLKKSKKKIYIYT